MHPLTRSLLVSLCSLFPSLAAQDGAPTPAPELKKLEPLVGNWAGTGTFVEPGAGASKWTAAGSYRWSHGGFFLQEDFQITFAGNPQPLVFRAYIGWDAERSCYVNASVNNAGEAQLNDFVLMPDGTMVQFMIQHQQGMPYAERSLFKIGGDKLTHTIDLMMGTGSSMQLVDGTFQKVDAAAPSALDTKATFGGATVHASMKQFARMVGVYDVTGSMVMTPGQPVTKITGVDDFRAVFGGTVLHAHTDGAAEGMPGKYESDAFWAYNQKKNCLVSVFVSNMGEVGTMESRFTPDGKALVSTSAATMTGQPMVQRFVLEVDGDGRPVRGVGHSIFGTMPPFESFQAAYKKK